MMTAGDILNAKILVVDDCADNSALQVDFLRLGGYTAVTSTNDSTKVCGLHAQNDYDLILLDMHMPQMSGLEVMAGLSKIEKDAYLPVLAITGDQRYKIAALDAGARDFLAKPYDLVEFKMRVRNLLEVRLLYKTVAEQSRLQKEMALHDSLTGLPNRRLLNDRIEKSMQHALRNDRMMAVMYIDLDGFKAINDVRGHQCGDELLKQVAERLREATRREDTVARIGGDEFIMVLSDLTHADDVVHPASKSLHLLAAPFHIGESPVSITGSVGVAFYPTDAQDADSLIALADQALYEAKRAGKNRCQFINRQTAMTFAPTAEQKLATAAAIEARAKNAAGKDSLDRPALAERSFT
ncbi:MAG: diguanylate cyclase domain-containing protein [Janthinobacterium lividum]